MARGIKRCNEANTGNWKKKPKERCKGEIHTENKENLRITIRNTTDACEKRILKDFFRFSTRKTDLVRLWGKGLE